MNRKKGLLAFLCTFLAVSALAIQVPFLSGIANLSAAAEGKTITHRSALLAKIFTPPTAPQIPTDAAGKTVVTLFQVQREHRSDAKLHELAQNNHIPFSILKAYLAIWSKGEVDENGFFWATIPGETPTDTTVGKKDTGLRSTTRMTNHLGKLVRRTSSHLAAIIASETGPERAARVAKFSSGSARSFLHAMRISLLAYYKQKAEQKLCSVLGLASALDARWPVADHDVQMRQGAGIRLATSPGEKILAPVSGTVSFSGQNDGGVCVEITTACDMRATICDIKTSTVKTGKHIEVGRAIGIAASQRPLYKVYLGAFAVDSSQFLHPSLDEESKPQSHQSTDPIKSESEKISAPEEQGDQNP